MRTITTFLLCTIISFTLCAQENYSFDNLNANGANSTLSFYNSNTSGSLFRLINSQVQGGINILDIEYLTSVGSIPSKLMRIYSSGVSVTSPFSVESSTSLMGQVSMYGNGQENLTVNMHAIFSQNVGIGTNNPVEKLHVNGSIRGGESGGTLKLKSSFGYLTLGAQNSFYSHFLTDRPQFFFNKPIFIDNGVLASYNTSDLKLQTNSNVRMTIKNSDGFVGIGTTIPDEKLTVKGKIHAEEVKIDLSVPGPDYVFEKYYTGKSDLKNDYEVPTLQEIEKFIKLNYHLPNVPSAEELKTNGLMVSEMTISLLQKIEELTLYAIEQEKRIEKLELKLGSGN